MTLLANATDIAISELRTNLPDLNVRRGSPLRLTLVDPFSLMAQPVVDEAVSLRRRLSLANIETMTEDDLDALAANVMLSRRQGVKARGTVRLYFADAATVSVQESTLFTSSEGPQFQAAASVEATSAGMRLNVDGSLYYLDVPVVATDVGAAGNVAANTINTVLDGPAGVVSATNKAAFVGGEDRESNELFAKRIPDAVAARSIVNRPGVRTVIQEAFPEVSRIQEIGFGDAEMRRDVITGTGIVVDGQSVGDGGEDVHIGGKIDIYVRTPGYVQQTVSLVAAAGDVKPIIVFGRDASADAEVSAPFISPMLGILSIQVGDPVTGICDGTDFLVEGTDYETVQENSGRSFSTRGVLRVHLLNSGPRTAELTEGVGRSLLITYLTNPDVASIQQFVDGDSVRHVCADILVKSFVPSFVDIDVTYFPKPASALAEGEEFASPEVVVGAIRLFLERSENATGFDIGELRKVLYGLAIVRFNEPLTVRTDMVDEHGLRVKHPAEGDSSPTCYVSSGSVGAVSESVRLALPGIDLGQVGVGLGDMLSIAESEREVIGVERALPGDATLTVLRFPEAIPASDGGAFTIKRSTINNIAPVPRTGALLARTIRALQLPI